MAASGAIVDLPLAAVAALNAVSLPGARMSYALMVQILRDDEAPLIFASLPISAAAITAGLAAYEASMAAGVLAGERAGHVATAA